MLGVDMTGDRSLRDYDLEGGDEAVIDDPLVFLAQPDSLILSKEFAERNHSPSAAGSRSAPSNGDKAFTVRGIMKSSGLASAFGGNLAIMDIYAAQKMFGRGRTFDRIDLAVQAGNDDRRGAARAAAAARPGLRGRAAVGPRPAVRGDAGGVLDDGEHLEPVRAVHRHVHHLQLVRDRRDAAPVRDRHSSRARRDAAADPLAVSRRERGDGSVGSLVGLLFGVAHRPRHRRLDRRI